MSLSKLLVGQGLVALTIAGLAVPGVHAELELPRPSPSATVQQTIGYADFTVTYSRPGVNDVSGRDYHAIGRVDPGLLEKLLPGLDADFYFCGPAAFLTDLQRGLRDTGVPASQIHTELF